MSEDMLVRRQISPQDVMTAVDLVTYHHGNTVEAPEPGCSWPKLCGDAFCRFPRYYRGGEPVGLVATVLVELGYPRDLLKSLDAEYEIGEVLHPGVKIGRSRNPALQRIDRPGVKLLAHLQDRQKLGQSWSDIADDAMRARRMIRYLDARRRPWLYSPPIVEG